MADLTFAAQCLYNAVEEKIADKWAISCNASSLEAISRTVGRMKDSAEFNAHAWTDEEIFRVIEAVCDTHGVEFDAGAVRDALQSERDAIAAMEVVSQDSKGRAHPSPIRLAEYLMASESFLLVRGDMSHDPDVYVYDKERGVYEQYCPAMIQGMAVTAMKRLGHPGILASKDAREAASQILMQTPDIIRQNRLNADENIIVFQNGVLELDSMTFREHSPRDFSTVCLNTTWAMEDGETPVFDAYMDDLCDGDEGKKTLILQFFGAVISNVIGWRFKKSLLMIGEGDAGKTQIIKLACRLLGDDNIQAISLTDLSSRFAVGSIAGRRLAFSGDMEYGKARDMSEFKRLTGGDVTRSERKGKDAQNTEFTGLFWFAANDWPRFGGDGGKWVYDRFMIIPVGRAIPEEKRDKRLLDKMMVEAPFIVRKAVMAMRECLATYRFSETEAIAEARDEYRTANDPIYRFMKELMIGIPENGTVIMPKGVRLDRMTISDIYKVYCGWYRKQFDDAYAGGLADFKKGIASYAGCKESELLRRASSGMVLRKYMPNWQKWVEEEIADIVEFSCVQVGEYYRNTETGESVLTVAEPNMAGAHIVRRFGN